MVSVQNGLLPWFNLMFALEKWLLHFIAQSIHNQINVMSNGCLRAKREVAESKQIMIFETIIYTKYELKTSFTSMGYNFDLFSYEALLKLFGLYKYFDIFWLKSLRVIQDAKEMDEKQISQSPHKCQSLKYHN